MKKYFLYLLVPLLLHACSSDDDTGMQTEIRAGNEVQFNVGFAPSTRATTDVDFESVFENGDEIGVFALEAGTTNVVYQNVKLIYTAGNWVAATDADKIYYPPGDSKLDFYAYYPYQGDHNTTMDNLSFAVLADQSEDDDYSKSDLLTATAMLQNTSTVNLSFTHLMSMIQVKATRVAPVPVFREGVGGFKVILKNVIHETDNINWVANSADAKISASVGDISMYRVPTTDGSWVFRALVPSQQVAAGKLFQFEQTLQGNKIDMSYNTASAVIYPKSNASQFQITLDYQLNPIQIYSVGDVYPHTGTPLGIVFETSNGGQNGKVVSLDEGRGIRWADAIYTLPITDVSNGRKNMQAIANYIAANNKSWSNFPVFEWIHSKNAANTDYSNYNATGIWYMPATSELQSFYCAINGKVPETWNYQGVPSWGRAQNTIAIEAFNQMLLSSGGEILGYPSQPFPYYMSSSVNVSQPNRSDNIAFTDGWRGAVQIDYNDGLIARAIMAF